MLGLFVEFLHSLNHLFTQSPLNQWLLKNGNDGIETYSCGDSTGIQPDSLLSFKLVLIQA